MTVYEQIKRLFQADQRDRRMLWRHGLLGEREFLRRLTIRDQQRIKQVRRILIENGPNLSKRALFLCGVILHHGRSISDHRLAAQLAKKSLSRGYAPAKKLYQAVIDRILVRKYGRQKYGTQFRMIGGKRAPFPINRNLKDRQ